MAAIELDGVTKRFGDVMALDDLDLAVEEGEIFGFLGPNGAGKTTTIDVLLDFVRPTSGSAEVLGMDVRGESRAIREETGILPEDAAVYERLTGRRHLEFVIESRRADDYPDDLLERVGLAGAGGRRAGTYSKGMRQRLAMAMALVGDPALLVLDEPSTGLDPNGARRMREITRTERDRGATVFFSSHVLGQVEAVCDTVGILRDGKLIAKDSVEGLREAAADDTTLSVTLADPDRADEAAEAARSVDAVSAVSVREDGLTIACDADAKMPVLNAIEDAGVEVADFATREASLEDVFAAYTEGERAGVAAE
jgi:ABC-2 type transport system ATP-binding protein